MSAKLEQDHDCVIEIIRNQFLNIKSHPTPSSNYRNISKLSTAILRLLRNQVNLLYRFQNYSSYSFDIDIRLEDSLWNIRH